MSVIGEDLTKGIIYVIGYSVVIFLGAPLVHQFLSKLKLSEEQKKSLYGIEGAGKIIGMIERVLIITFMYSNVPTAIALIFTAKSIIRFQSAKERPFAEYYLIGTLTSITFASLVGAFVVWVEKLIT